MTITIQTKYKQRIWTFGDKHRYQRRFGRTQTEDDNFILRSMYLSRLVTLTKIIRKP